MTTSTFTTGTRNLANGAGTPGPFAHVIGWQGARTSGDLGAVRQNLGPAYEHYAPTGWAAALPISWRKDLFDVIDSGHALAHESGSHYGHPDTTNERGCTWVILRSKKNKTADPVAFINGDMIHNAFKVPAPADQAWRRRMWAMHAVVYTRLAHRFLHAGYDVIAVGTVNSPHWDPLHGLTDARVGQAASKKRPLPERIMSAATDTLNLLMVSATDKNSPTGRAVTAGWSQTPAEPEPVDPPKVSTDVDKVIAYAKSQVGYHESQSGGHWTNGTKYAAIAGMPSMNGQPWCATFVYACAVKAGVPRLFPKTASCDVAGAWYKNQGRWSEYPAIGAQVFYGYPTDLNHTGIVTGFDKDNVYTVEGNTNNDGSREGDGVYAKVRPRRGSNIIGYGYPNYPGGIKSADPAWATGHYVAPGTHPPTPAPMPAPQPPHTDTPTHPLPARGLDGVDISHYQPNVDLKAAKRAGVRFLYHKITEATGYVDDTYARHRRQARLAGIPFGAYHFARPSAGSGRTQARHMLKNAGPRPGDLIPMLDLEDDGGLSRAQLTRWVAGFVSEVRKQTGVRPIIYTPFDLDKTFGCLLWVARYSDDYRPANIPAPWKWAAIWQHSNGVYGPVKTVPGIGPCDVNGLHPTVPVSRLVIPGNPHQLSTTKKVLSALTRKDPS